AEKVTPEAINFMATHARGLICLSLTSEQVTRLGLPMMATNNQSAYNTAFTVSIEAREGVTTGISASDRAHTTLVAIAEDANQRHIVTPGHVFPLRARDGGVLERVGQTEGSVDLARLAGLNPSGVICEIMNADGTMSRMPQLKEFGRAHEIRIVADELNAQRERSDPLTEASKEILPYQRRVGDALGALRAI
ncbi:MAG: 3,4-dihydroxy-2-butanone-4-phosphate synthase, partial [bacterium]|nr:3,4-dihydroxy-2-butanone-4-phosphate synthase [bacterium]